jgi:hypothetical protein
MRLYVNGTQVDSTPTSGPQWTSDPLWIGCNDDWEEGFSGKIDEARVYDRALSQKEVEPDLIPPTDPRNFEASWEAEPEAEEGEENSTYITWTPSIDPPLPDGQAGSGVKYYKVQYKLPGEISWSQVETTDIAAISVQADEMK